MRVTDSSDLIRIVAGYYGLTRSDVIGERRLKTHCKARMIVMHLLREKGGLSLAEIGGILNRDHTTVINGLMRMRIAMIDDSVLAQQVDRLSDAVCVTDEDILKGLVGTA